MPKLAAISLPNNFTGTLSDLPLFTALETKTLLSKASSLMKLCGKIWSISYF